MSLSWRDRLYVALTPSRIDLVRVSGWLRRSVSCAELAPAAGAGGEAAWGPALSALRVALPRLAPRGARCAAVLSSHFCRYMVLPDNAGLANARETEAYARLKLEEIYGAGAAAAWEVRVGAAPPGASRLVCAVDAALMDGLRSACAEARVQLASVRPLLVASFEHSRRRFGSGHFWFAAAEEGRLCLGAVENYTWRSIVSQRIGRDLVAELTAMLHRARIMAPGPSAERVYLYSRDVAGDRAAAVPGITLLPHAVGGGAEALARGRVFA